MSSEFCTFVSRWLTDMQCQKVLEEREAEPEPKPDEDGPPSSEGAEERSTSEESAGSEDDPPEKPHGAIYGGYFEHAWGRREGSVALCIARPVRPDSPQAAEGSPLCDSRRKQLFGRPVRHRAGDARGYLTGAARAYGMVARAACVESAVCH